MGKKLALRGHESRGKEVIKILEMMGGHATVINKISNETNKVFFISDNENCFYKKSIRFILDSSKEIEEFNVFTLEEFLEKYPFKVGELKDLIYDHISCVISEMRWNVQDECMEYHAEFGPNDYGWYRVYDFCRDYQIEKSNTVISGINLNSCDYADEVELNLGDYEIEVRDGRTYAVKKKSKYPTTYEDCCKNVFGLVHEGMTVDVPMNYSPLIINFTKLLICRDAYWKIAGKEIGLGKYWCPCDTKDKYVLRRAKEEIIKGYNISSVLEFPTEKIRDAFYENFKDLIEECKELL